MRVNLRKRGVTVAATEPTDRDRSEAPDQPCIAVVCCGVLDWNIQRVAAGIPNREFIIRSLPAGLHNNPVKLRQLLQEHIDQLSEEAVQGIVIGYGLCGRGTVGLQARSKPLVLPRTQDCIGILLGSHARYLKQFHHRPGTRYLSQGWYEKTVREPQRHTYHADQNRALYGPSFEQLREHYGESNARTISEFRDSWKRNYQRAAYIRFSGERAHPPGQDLTEGLADTLGWEHEVLEGDESLLQAMMEGRWQDPRLLVVPRDARTVAAPGNAILAFTHGAGAAVHALVGRYQADSAAGGSGPVRTGLGLGIDTGGTFTDAVVFDFDSDRVTAFAKAPTTHGRLVDGIREALDRLPAEELSRISRVGLSTTLATNAFVEQKGRAVGLLVMCPYPVEKERFPFRYVHHIAGNINMRGEETAPLDPEEIRLCARQARETGCEAVAISGFGGVVNPAHELTAARIILEETGLHAVCGHELTTKLNFVERATTAAMNARLVPLIESLIDAVQQALEDKGLEGVRMMVVKGDGSQLLAEVARSVPVETVLSGPAASVVGAAKLFQVPEAVVADLGGTTLDVAAIRNGTAVISESGARIGRFQTSVRAMEVRTIGLGGDSEIDLSGWPDISIGPRRVIPLSRLGECHPEAIPGLDARFRASIGPSANCLDMVSAAPGVDCAGHRLLDHLKAGPMTLAELARRTNRAFACYIDWKTLETKGRLLRFGLTPTDVLHVEDRFRAFDRRPADACLKHWSALFEVDVDEILERIHHEFRRMVCDALLGVMLPESCPWDSAGGLRHWLTDHFTDVSRSRDAGVVFTPRLRCPVIGVGAPAGALLSQMAEVLGQDVLISDVAQVANAVGAIAGDVLVHETATIRIPDDGAMVCSWRGGATRASSLEEALGMCEAGLTDLVRAEAEANEIPFSTPAFTAAVQEGRTRDGPVVFGVVLQAALRG